MPNTNNNKVTYAIALGCVALVLALIALFGGKSAPLSTSGPSAPQAGAIGGSAGAGTASPVASYVYPNPSNYDYLRSVALEVDSQFLQGGWTVTTAIDQVPVIGSCFSGSYAASSTAFGLTNPFAATSTFTFISLTGTGNATSTALLIGTSTQAVGIAQSTITAVIASTTIASSTPFTFTPGIPGAGGGGGASTQMNSGGSRTIEVGPNQFVVALATSTGIQSNSYSPGLGSTCTYKGRWEI